jgi:hypothetical protein
MPSSLSSQPQSMASSFRSHGHRRHSSYSSNGSGKYNSVMFAMQSSPLLQFSSSCTASAGRTAPNSSAAQQHLQSSSWNPALVHLEQRIMRSLLVQQQRHQRRNATASRSISNDHHGNGNNDVATQLFGPTAPTLSTAAASARFSASLSPLFASAVALQHVFHVLVSQKVVVPPPSFFSPSMGGVQLSQCVWVTNIPLHLSDEEFHQLLTRPLELHAPWSYVATSPPTIPSSTLAPVAILQAGAPFQHHQPLLPGAGLQVKSYVYSAAARCAYIACTNIEQAVLVVLRLRALLLHCAAANPSAGDVAAPPVFAFAPKLPPSSSLAFLRSAAHVSFCNASAPELSSSQSQSASRPHAALLVLSNEGVLSGFDPSPGNASAAVAHSDATSLVPLFSLDVSVGNMVLLRTSPSSFELVRNGHAQVYRFQLSVPSSSSSSSSSSSVNWHAFGLGKTHMDRLVALIKSKRCTNAAAPLHHHQRRRASVSSMSSSSSSGPAADELTPVMPMRDLQPESVRAAAVEPPVLQPEAEPMLHCHLGSHYVTAPELYILDAHAQAAASSSFGSAATVTCFACLRARALALLGPEPGPLHGRYNDDAALSGSGDLVEEMKEEEECMISNGAAGATMNSELDFSMQDLSDLLRPQEYQRFVELSTQKLLEPEPLVAPIPLTAGPAAEEALLGGVTDMVSAFDPQPPPVTNNRVSAYTQCPACHARLHVDDTAEEAEGRELSESECAQALEQASLTTWWAQQTGSVYVCHIPTTNRAFEFAAHSCLLCAAVTSHVFSVDGRPPSVASYGHFLRNRVLCRAIASGVGSSSSSSCCASFCRSCRATPFHIGFSCAEAAEWAASPRCRFCLVAAVTRRNRLVGPPSRALNLVCAGEECVAKSKISCLKCHDDDGDDGDEDAKEDEKQGHAMVIVRPSAATASSSCSSSSSSSSAPIRRHRCSHPCGGVRHEHVCLPCLEPECVEARSHVQRQNSAADGTGATDVDKEAECGICFTEGQPKHQTSRRSHIAARRPIVFLGLGCKADARICFFFVI